MSWWTEYTPHVPLIAGAVAGGVMAWLRNFSNKQMTRAAKLAEAATCAGLSTAISEACTLYLSWPENWAVPIGVFVGWLGTDTLRSALAKLFDKFLNK